MFFYRGQVCSRAVDQQPNRPDTAGQAASVGGVHQYRRPQHQGRTHPRRYRTQGYTTPPTPMTLFRALSACGCNLTHKSPRSGANQFKDSITINTVALLSGSPKGLTIGFNITVQNPLPNVAMNAGNLFMKMRYVGAPCHSSSRDTALVRRRYPNPKTSPTCSRNQKNVVIAEAEVAKFNLGLGTTTLSGEGLYTRPKGPGSALAIEFISGFISGKTRPARLVMDGGTDVRPPVVHCSSASHHASQGPTPPSLSRTA